MITDKFGKLLYINDTVVTVHDNKLKVCTVIDNTFKKDYVVLKYINSESGCCQHKNNVIKV